MIIKLDIVFTAFNIAKFNCNYNIKYYAIISKLLSYLAYTLTLALAY